MHEGWVYYLGGEWDKQTRVLSALKITVLEINLKTTPRKDLLFSYLTSYQEFKYGCSIPPLNIFESLTLKKGSKLLTKYYRETSQIPENLS